MQCTRCGHTTSEHGASYCAHCGDRLGLACPSCESAIQADQQFCSQCGLALRVGCPKCGAANPLYYRGCHDCGHLSPHLCAKCGQFNLPGSRFCGFCSTTLSHGCPHCGFTNLPRQTFCGQCQRQLSAESPPIGQSTGGSAPTGVQPFALVALEWVNRDELAERFPVQFDGLANDLAQWITARVVAHNGLVEGAHHGAYFCAFAQSASIEQSVSAALACVKALLGEGPHMEGIPILLRAGVDVAHPDARNPLTAIQERSQAKPGEVVWSAQVARVLSDNSTRWAVPTPVVMSAPVVAPPPPVPFAPILSPSELEEAPANPVVAPAPALVLTPPAEPVAEPPLNTVEEPALMPPVSEATAPTEPDPVAPPVAEAPAPLPASPLAEAEPTEPTASVLPGKQPPAALPDLLPIPKFWEQSEALKPTHRYDQAVQAIAAQLEKGVGAPLALCGDDGLGKSYIVQMVRAQVDPDAQSPKYLWLGGNGDAAPLSLWLDMLQSFLGLPPEGMPAHETQATYQSLVEQMAEVHKLLPAQRTLLTDLFAVTLGVSDTEPASDNLLVEGLTLLLQLLATQKPLVLLLEDIDRADPASLEVLCQLGTVNNVQLIVTFLPTSRLLEPIRLAFLAMQTMVIAPFDRGEIERFLSEGPLSGHFHDLPSQLSEHLISFSQGLPFYLEESLRLLYAEGVLEVDPKSGALLPKRDLPHGYQPKATLNDVILGRFLTLEPENQLLLQVAAILGEKCSLSALMTLTQLETEAISLRLNALWEQGWLMPEAGNACRFRHRRLREVALSTLTPERLQEISPVMGEYAQAWSQHATQTVPLLARCSVWDPANGFEYLHQAGVWAARLGSLTAVNLLWGQALRLCAGTEWQAELEEQLISLNAQHHPEAATAMIRQLIPHETGPRRIEWLHMLATCHEASGEAQLALKALDDALQLLPVSQFPAEHRLVSLQKADVLMTLGQVNDAHTLLQRYTDPQALLMQAELGLLRASADGLAAIPPVNSPMEDPALTQRLHLTWFDGYLYKGLYSQCQQLLVGKSGPAWTLRTLMLQSELGQWDALLQTCQQLPDSRLGDLHRRLFEACAFLGRGQHEVCLSLLPPVVDAANQLGQGRIALMALRMLAEAAGLTASHWETATAFAEERGMVAEGLKLIEVKARLLLNATDTRSAGKVLEPCWHQVLDSGSNPLVARHATQIGRLYQQLSQQADDPVKRERHELRASEFMNKARDLWKTLGHSVELSKLDDLRAVTPY